MDVYKNQQQRLLVIVNKPLPTRCVRGTDRFTSTTKEKRHIITEANLLWSQATTAGGWNILRDEIANFLSRVK
jgi:hypothetical protein